MTLAVSLNGMAASGYGVNHVDISPKFAGYLMGITNTMGTIPGIVAPIVAKAIALPVSALIIIMTIIFTIVTSYDFNWRKKNVRDYNYN